MNFILSSEIERPFRGSLFRRRPEDIAGAVAEASIVCTRFCKSNGNQRNSLTEFNKQSKKKHYIFHRIRIPTDSALPLHSPLRLKLARSKQNLQLLPHRHRLPRHHHLIRRERIRKQRSLRRVSLHSHFPRFPRVFRQPQQRVVVHVGRNRDALRRVLHRAQRDLLGTAEREELCPEPAGAVVGVDVDAAREKGLIIAGHEQSGEEAGVVALPEGEQLVGEDHGEPDGLDGRVETEKPR